MSNAETIGREVARSLTGRAKLADVQPRPTLPRIGNVKIDVPHDQRQAFAFVYPWRVEARQSRFHPWKTVRPCQKLDGPGGAVELYEFLGEWPLSRIRVN